MSDFPEVDTSLDAEDVLAWIALERYALLTAERPSAAGPERNAG
ncbi:hypothetical protein ATK30_0339 [Amycolatopsis echigonensis]|uniref:Uncharacterized protein n=1 Tax=Amycolatopsis echigonensis TaxID=2576905 RepID=A0A2N3X288_9PSEU|nr:hypothetical protein [Amycolatopsis niigatensis]PKW00244.1 hypothetical protein ATK30_0339 [Amycolatopsis niigatensis]